MIAQPPTPATVSVPVKPARDSRLVWILGTALVLWLVTLVAPEAAALGITLPTWVLLVARLASAALTGLGLLVRLAMPDVVSGIPWLDKSTSATLAAPKDGSA
jgi:hypothetical protein